MPYPIAKQESRTADQEQEITVEISFLFEICPIEYTDDPRYPRIEGQQGLLWPSRHRRAFREVMNQPRQLYRWENGIVTPVGSTDPARSVDLTHFRTASIFAHAETSHLLVVMIDCTQQHVAHCAQGDWKLLSFRHLPNGMSYLDPVGELPHLAARAVRPLIPELLPSVYQYPHRYENEPPPAQRGLCGRLPLLLALAAFSGSEDQLDNILTSYLDFGTWYGPHNDDHGRTVDRGMRIRVWLDPCNRPGSTRSILKDLEQGEYGAFYAPQ
ncbi:MAG: hypothetical protein M1817_000494 [Caeruleum heppii]|nr:MAG: hypothetical protein M1817_000494 [Caeruleum heppii]